MHRNESAPNAKELQHGSRSEPFLRDGDDDELVCNDAQTEHGGESEACGQTHHLLQSSALLLAVVHLGKKGLRHAVKHLRNETMPHCVPFISLREFAQFATIEELTEQN